MRVNQIQSKTGRKSTIKRESKKMAMKQSMVCLSCYASVRIHQDDSTVSLESHNELVAKLLDKNLVKVSVDALYTELLEIY